MAHGSVDLCEPVDPSTRLFVMGKKFSLLIIKKHRAVLVKRTIIIIMNN